MQEGKNNVNERVNIIFIYSVSTENFRHALVLVHPHQQNTMITYQSRNEKLNEQKLWTVH